MTTQIIIRTAPPSHERDNRRPWSGWRLARISGAAFLVLGTLSGNARALTVPDTGTCGGGTCLTLTNTMGSGTALAGQSVAGAAVTGTDSGSGQGVIGRSSSFYGVHGISDSGTAVRADSTSGSGVVAISEQASGVVGSTSAAFPAAGVYGTSNNTTSGVGVYGSGVGAGIGVWGTGAWGMQGYSASATNGLGVSGVAGGPGGHGLDGICNQDCQTSTTGAAVVGTNNGTVGVAGRFTAPNTTSALYVNGNIFATGTITHGFSDKRLKKEIQPLAGALDRLLQLKGVTFEWKDPAANGNQKGTQRGFIAQDVEKVMPEWIKEDERGFKMIAIPGRSMEAMLVESIRTLKAQNDELQRRVQLLEAGRGQATTAGTVPGLGASLALGLLPLGIVVALRSRKKR